MKTQKIEISYKTVLFTIGVLMLLALLYHIRVILLQVFVGLILMTALNPTVNKVERIRLGNSKPFMSRVGAILVTYLTAFLVLLSFVAMIAQPLTEQTLSLLRYLGEDFGQFGLSESFLSQQLSQLTTLSSNIFRVIGGVFSNVFTIGTTLVISFYLLLERKNLHSHIVKWFGNPPWEKHLDSFIDQLETNMGGWVRAELVLMLAVGAISYLGFVILQIPYALPLALLAGLFEIIPNIGPAVAAIPAAIAGFAISPLVGLAVLTWSVVVQQLENNFIVPQVMSKSAGVNPLVTIVSLLIGFKIAGVTGAILAVPTIIIIQTVFQVFGKKIWHGSLG